MAGAYVAKPDVVSMPDVPPGWNPNWPFPGAYPPGYIPILTIIMGSDIAVSVGSSVSVTTSFRDHATYATNEPNTVYFTATINSVLIRLRWSGDALYGYSANDSAAFDTYWNTSNNLIFDIDESNTGDIIVLTASSSVGNDLVSETASITVSNIHSAVLTFTATFIEQTGDFLEYYPGEWSMLWDCALDGTETLYPDDQYGWGLISFDKDGETYVTNETERNGAISEQDIITDTITLTIAELDKENFDVRLHCYPTYCTAQFVATLTIDDEVVGTKTIILIDEEDPDVYMDTWIQIDGTTGEVTVIDS